MMHTNVLVATSGDGLSSIENVTETSKVGVGNGTIASACESCGQVAAILYIIQGILLTTANIFILAIVFHHPRLRHRKVYLMVAALALVDGMGGVATLTGGIGRLRVVLYADQYALVSRVDCLLRPWNLFFIFTDPLAHFILLVISFDRLFAIRKSREYINLTHRYVIAALGGVVAFWSVNVFTGVMLTLPYTQPEVGALCYTAWSLQPDYYLYHGGIGAAADLLSVGIYIIIVLVVRRMNKVYPSGSSAEKRNMHRIRRITVTLGLASMFTAIFYTLPLVVKLVANNYFSEETMSMILPFTFLVNNINQLANFFLYTTRQKKVREAVCHLVKCKKISGASHLLT